MKQVKISQKIIKDVLGNIPLNMGINDFVFLCKEVAWNKYHITIRSGVAEFGGWSNFAHNPVSFVSMAVPYTEQEAIIKAYDWILKNAKRKEKNYEHTPKNIS